MGPPRGGKGKTRERKEEKEKEAEGEKELRNSQWFLRMVGRGVR